MAIDVGIFDSRGIHQHGPVATLRDDGYYWFLYPLIEKLAQSYGKHIDLYGDAVFRHAELPILVRFLNESEEMVKAQPQKWRVQTGTQTYPEVKQLVSEVDRGAFLSLLSNLREIVARAEESEATVRFIGD